MLFQDHLADRRFNEDAVRRLTLDILQERDRFGARAEAGLALAAFPAQTPAPLLIDIDPEQRPGRDARIIVRHRPLKSGNRYDLSNNLAGHCNLLLHGVAWLRPRQAGAVLAN